MVTAAARRVVCWVISVHLAAGALCAAERQREDYRLDDEVFGRGLVARGLDHLWRLYDQRHAPTTDLSLLQREVVQAWREYLGAGKGAERKAALDRLLQLQRDRIAVYADQDLAPVWRVRLADDLLHCQGGEAAFVQLIGLALPQQQAKAFGQTLQEAQRLLEAACGQLEQRLRRFEGLAEGELEHLNRRGLVEVYERYRRYGRYLLAWVELHRLLLNGATGGGEPLQRVLSLADGVSPGTGTNAHPSLRLLRAIAYRRGGKFAEAEAALAAAVGDANAAENLYLAIERIQLALARGKADQADRLVKAALSKLADGRLRASDRRSAEAALLLLQGRSRLGALYRRSDGKVSADQRRGCWEGLTQFLGSAQNVELFDLIWPGVAEAGERWTGDRAEALAEIELLAAGMRHLRAEQWSAAGQLLERAIEGSLPGGLRLAALPILSRCCYRQGRKHAAAEYLLSAGDAEQDEARKRSLYEQAASIAWEQYAQSGSDRSARLLARTGRAFLAHDWRGGQADRCRVLAAEALLTLGRWDEAAAMCAGVEKSSRWYCGALGQRIRALCGQTKGRLDSGRIRRLLDELGTVASSAGDDDAVRSWVVGQAVLAAGRALMGTDPAFVAEMLRRNDRLLKDQDQADRGRILRIEALLASGDCSSLRQACELAEQVGGEERHRRRSGTGGWR